MIRSIMVSIELLERCTRVITKPRDETVRRRALNELRAVLAQEAGPGVVVQVATMPVERCYDVRAKMIIAFNEARKNGGDLDDGLDAAYKSALRYSPNPLLAEQPAPVAVVPHVFCKGFNTLEQKDGKYTILMRFGSADDAWSAYEELCRLSSNKVKEMNQ